MIGPDMAGLGGISRVVRTWKESRLFEETGVIYIPTASDFCGKVSFFLRHYLTFLLRLPGCRLVYIHTSSNRSFFRKSLFLLASLVFHKRVIFHIHPTHFYEFLLSLRGLTRSYCFALLGRVSRFVTLTEGMQDRVASLFPHIPVSTLRNPVDLAVLSGGTDSGRKDNSLLYLGWYIREKGIYELVDAVQSLLGQGYNVTLNFYGTKDDRSLKRYVAEKGLEGNIIVNGWIEDRDKRQILRECTLLILPSHSEGIPNVILEAMATATPIIATRVGGLGEILQDRVNAVVARDRNPVDLAHKIRLCLDDAGLRKRIAANAYMEATSKYDITVVKKDVAAILTLP